jgi:hypothetical protein
LGFETETATSLPDGSAGVDFGSIPDLVAIFADESRAPFAGVFTKGSADDFIAGLPTSPAAAVGMKMSSGGTSRSFARP